MAERYTITFECTWKTGYWPGIHVYLVYAKNKEDFAGLLQDFSFSSVIHWFQCKQKAGSYKGQLCWNPSSSTAFLLGALNLRFFHIKTNPELETIRPLSHQASINKTCICTVFSYSLLCGLETWTFEWDWNWHYLGWGREGKPDGNCTSFASFGNPGCSTIKSLLLPFMLIMKQASVELVSSLYCYMAKM